MMKSGNDYGVKVIRAYEMKRVGQVIFPSGVERQRLIQMGFVEAVKPPKERGAVSRLTRRK